MRRTLNKLQHHLFPGIDDHLTDDKVASFICDDMSFLEKLIAWRHLARCHQCRMWKKAIEESNPDQMIWSYRNALARFNVPLTEKLRRVFVARLDSQIDRGSTSLQWNIRRVRAFHANFLGRKAVFATVSILSLMIIATSLYLWQRNAPAITPNALLTDAEKSDARNSASGTVVYQAVRITMLKQSTRESSARSIYRDVVGRRQVRLKQLNATDKRLKDTLTNAGLNWDEPLSASNYQEWHDHQAAHKDYIVWADAHLLRLTTTSSSGTVAEQSLTVRDTDFHPVERTVAFRDKSTIEIAELDFKVLPWNAVGADEFEPLRPTALGTLALPDHIQLPHPPAVLSEDQLDETELGVKLMLNQLRADSREQIEIRRSPKGVTVAGLVESESRKRELEGRLQMVPHVTVSIQSAEHLRANPSSMDPVVSVATATMPDQPSPLKIYLQKRGHSVEDINSFEEQIFDSALAISEESREIVNLQTRFNTAGPRTAFASATLLDLIYSHRDRLRAAVKHEREILAEVQTPSHEFDADNQRSLSLTNAADRNLELSKELTQTHSQAPRSAENILQEMSLTTHDLTLHLHDSYGQSQTASDASKNK